jgi:hypothetical protein
MKTDAGKPCFIEEWLEGPAQDIARFYRLTDLVRKDQVMIVLHRPKLEPNDGLLVAVMVQDVYRARRQGNMSARAGHFGLCQS